jgi:hypothetical protein
MCVKIIVFIALPFSNFTFIFWRIRIAGLCDDDNTTTCVENKKYPDRSSCIYYYFCTGGRFLRMPCAVSDVFYIDLADCAEPNATFVCEHRCSTPTTLSGITTTTTPTTVTTIELTATTTTPAEASTATTSPTTTSTLIPEATTSTSGQSLSNTLISRPYVVQSGLDLLPVNNSGV